MDKSKFNVYINSVDSKIIELAIEYTDDGKFLVNNIVFYKGENRYSNSTCVSLYDVCLCQKNMKKLRLDNLSKSAEFDFIKFTLKDKETNQKYKVEVYLDENKKFKIEEE